MRFSKEKKAKSDCEIAIFTYFLSKTRVKLWKKLVGYHDRSLLETAFSRFKGIFGPRLFSRSIDNQEVELKLKAYVLNEMTKQGMPNGVMI